MRQLEGQISHTNLQLVIEFWDVFKVGCRPSDCRPRDSINLTEMSRRCGFNDPPDMYKRDVNEFLPYLNFHAFTL
jgi:hypothetical protein